MQDTRCVSLEEVNPRLVVRNGGFERPEFGRLTPERSIRSTIEPEPAAPIILRDGQHLADGSTVFIKEPLFRRFDFITLHDGGRRCHAIRQHLIGSMST